MTTPVPDADAAEQRRPADADQSDGAPPAVGDGAPEADVVEQSQPVGPAPGRLPSELPLEADDADAAEQAVDVPLDEDEDRE